MRKLKNIAAFCALLIATVLLSACGGSEGSAGHNLDGVWNADGRMFAFSGDTFRYMWRGGVNYNLAAGTFTITGDTINFEQTVEFPWYRTTPTPSGEFERIDEDTVRFGGLGTARFRRVTDPERITSFEERWNNEAGVQGTAAAEPPQTTPTPTPATPPPNEPPTTPTPPPSDEEFGYTGEVIIPIGRWHYEHIELRLYDDGVGFVFAEGEEGESNFTRLFTWFVDDGQVMLTFFDGSMGWQPESLAVNEATGELFMSANNMRLGRGITSVMFEPHYRQLNVSHNDERIVGEWESAIAEFPTVEFLPGGLGTWHDTHLGTQQFSWLFDEDVLLVWGITHDSGEPHHIIAFEPLSITGDFLTIARGRPFTERFERRTGNTGGLLGEWACVFENEVVLTFEADMTGTCNRFGEVLDFTFDELGAEFLRMYMTGLGHTEFSRFRVHGDTLHLYHFDYLLQRR